ncbi:hypothetical protein V5799_025082 [Amblyomma americanum]|uniref:Uncharacterized protein n=1 Tax=Amblyomma americanum TaxID=6943 RepID=A0AAQ4EAA3_AMBAM
MRLEGAVVDERDRLSGSVAFCGHCAAALLLCPAAGKGAQEGGPSVSNMALGKEAQLPSFWVPSLTPSASKDKLEKPKNVVLCPMSGKPLKAKDLIPIKFTPVVDPDDRASLITKKASSFLSSCSMWHCCWLPCRDVGVWCVLVR